MLQTVVGWADNGGAYGMLETLSPGLDHCGTHRRGRVVLRARRKLTFYCDTRLDLTAGGFAFGPKNVPHTFIGAGPEPTRALVGFAPMQFEGFMREAGQPAPARVLPPPHDGPPPDVARLAPIAKRNGFIILGPPGPPPGR
jgi:hypothetical protein